MLGLNGTIRSSTKSFEHEEVVIDTRSEVKESIRPKDHGHDSGQCLSFPKIYALIFCRSKTDFEFASE